MWCPIPSPLPSLPPPLASPPPLRQGRAGQEAVRRESLRKLIIMRYELSCGVEPSVPTEENVAVPNQSRSRVMSRYCSPTLHI